MATRRICASAINCAGSLFFGCLGTSRPTTPFTTPAGVLPQVGVTLHLPARALGAGMNHTEAHRRAPGPHPQVEPTGEEDLLMRPAAGIRSMRRYSPVWPADSTHSRKIVGVITSALMRMSRSVTNAELSRPSHAVDPPGVSPGGRRGSGRGGGGRDLRGRRIDGAQRSARLRARQLRWHGLPGMRRHLACPARVPVRRGDSPYRSSGTTLNANASGSVRQTLELL